MEQDVDDARLLWHKLGGAGIDLMMVTDKLQEQGVKSFADAFNGLFTCLQAKSDLLRSGLAERQTVRLGKYQSAVDNALEEIQENNFIVRMWKKDATLWKKAASQQTAIANRLGWLFSPDLMEERIDELVAFADEIKAAGFKHVMLLGMGGSSLCPEVFRMTFGVRKGYPQLLVLDTTDPATILDFEKQVELNQTLFIPASKSGTTTEVNSFLAYFWNKVQGKRGAKAGDNFVAITDSGTPLEKLAREKKFRRIFLNPADIGGRYSALSYFGLVPAALIGMDLKELLHQAGHLVQSSQSCVPAKDSPALVLGAIMGELAKAGRDKITFILSPVIASFGYWVEQLIAESTGKEGRGILPVEGEMIAPPERYGHDRLFVHIRMDKASQTSSTGFVFAGTVGLRGVKKGHNLDELVSALQEAGHPVVTIRCAGPYTLGGEFFRWEVATAVAAARLGVNPFDEPNVTESKDNTKRLLGEYMSSGKLPQGKPILRDKNFTLFGEQAEKDLASTLRAFFQQAKPGDYVTLSAYLQMKPAYEKHLQNIRRHLRDRLKIATTLGYGPRFLHSTGQLHKGGAANGIFLQITADDEKDIPIPGEKYSFGVLKAAQALGDWQALTNRKRRALRVHISGNIEKGLAKLAKAAMTIGDV